MHRKTPFIHRNLPRLLLQARDAVMAHTRPSLREHGLSDQQWRVLRVLGEHAHDPAGIETGRVARQAWLLGPSLTGVLSRMERDGLIERLPDPEDGRGWLLRLKPAGRGLYQKIVPVVEAREAFLLEVLTREEREVLERALAKVLERARALGP